MKLKDANVLLTGAAGGIGSVIAEQLCRRGARVLLTDLREDALARVAAACAGLPGAVEVLAANITSESGRRDIVARAQQAGVNVLINLAGINPFGLLAEQTDAEIERTLAVNTVAPMQLCRALLPALCQRDSAHIVNVGSTFGSIGFPGYAAYSASKFALHGFSEALRRELADTRVCVHYVAPRATRTDLNPARVIAMNETLKVAMDPPSLVARAVIQTLCEERAELFLGWPERLFVKLNALWPALVDRALRKQLPIVQHYATHAPAPAAANKPVRPAHASH